MRTRTRIEKGQEHQAAQEMYNALLRHVLNLPISELKDRFNLETRHFVALSLSRKKAAKNHKEWIRFQVATIQLFCDVTEGNMETVSRAEKYQDVDTAASWNSHK